jgi:hypothetical protein
MCIDYRETQKRKSSQQKSPQNATTKLISLDKNNAVSVQLTHRTVRSVRVPK